MKVLGDASPLVPFEFAATGQPGTLSVQAVEPSLAALQRAGLLPRLLPQIPGCQVAARYVAGGIGAEVLGDFYDVFPSVRGSWGVVVGDVCGKGALAANGTVLARSTLRTAARRRSKPSVVLAALNRALLDWSTDDDQFLTAIYATVRPTASGASVQIGCAGHPLALVHRADGRVRAFGRPGTLLGPFPDPHVRDCRTELRAGDSLVLFTDGVIEARRQVDREMFGDARLRAVIATTAGMSASRVAETVRQAVLSYGGQPVSDDTVVLVLRTAL